MSTTGKGNLGVSVLLLITHVNLQLAQNKKFNVKIHNQSQWLVSDFCEMRAVLWPLFTFLRCCCKVSSSFVPMSSSCVEIIMYKNNHALQRFSRDIFIC